MEIVLLFLEVVFCFIVYVFLIVNYNVFGVKFIGY